MSLTLTIENVERLDNEQPVQLKLDRHGAVIGRSPHADWTLPDPKNYISSTHCEIDYRDGRYVLIDKSTNGTLLNNEAQRIEGPRPLKNGDVVVIGHYRIAVRGDEPVKSEPAPAFAPPPARQGGWDGWETTPTSAPPAPASVWDTPAAPPPQTPAGPAPASSGWAAAPATPPPVAAPSPTLSPPAAGWANAPAAPATPVRSGWDEPAPAASAWASPTPAPAKGGSGWDNPPPTASAPAAADPWGAVGAAQAPKSGWDPVAAPGAPTPSPWESAPSAAISGRGPMAQNWAAPKVEAPPPAADDVWGRFEASNVIDWSRGGFGDPAPAAPVHAPGPAAAPGPPAAATGDGVWSAFIAASGVAPDMVRAAPMEAATAAGTLLRRLVAGLVVMMEARARAKAQLGAQSTTLELGGNNPIKFARSPEKVLAQLLSPPERGFMDAERAVTDSFQDLQAHQMATLAAMQGALRSTLDRFSPEAIRSRAETRGLLARILPSARNAALWEAYQKEFEGVARGSDEAFLDVFAKAFKAAYEKAAADMKHGAR